MIKKKTQGHKRKNTTNRKRSISRARRRSVSRMRRNKSRVSLNEKIDHGSETTFVPHFLLEYSSSEFSEKSSMFSEESSMID